MDINTKARVKCKKGHSFFWTKKNMSCPICERQKMAKLEFFEGVPPLIKKALEGLGIRSTYQLSRFKEEEITRLHGMSYDGVLLLHEKLKQDGMDFRK